MAGPTAVRRADLAALPKARLVALLWELQQVAVEAAQQYHADSPEAGGRDVCVLSPNSILEPLEDATGRCC